ncbi:FtsX-like permease family protein [Candidatus Woesearchaeota archaeon]|nr:FtsX-like permease family protein [Candidatus Woesearchaeota archaeon]
MIKDFFRYALTSMRQRKLRSWLTIIGIIIGIASIIALIAISQGMQNYVEEQFEEFGTNMIIIRPGTLFAPPGAGEYGLNEGDVDVIERVAGVDYVVPMIYDYSNVEFHREEVQAQIFGVPTEHLDELMDDTGWKVEKGSVFKRDDDYSAVIGYLAKTEMFDDDLHIRNSILIEGEKYKIIGILEEIGNEQDDTMIMIPMDRARDIVNKSEEVSMIMAFAKQGVDINELTDEIADELEDSRGEEDFTAMSSVQLIEQISEILGVISLIVGAIASISLLVGAVGIMNTMYTSVLERTREIGVMKAIGATNANILGIFLIESGLIGLVGGTIGVAIGAGLALLVGYISPSLELGFSLVIRIEPSLIIFGILFAFILGAIAGLLPARSASKLKPADALRYE